MEFISYIGTLSKPSPGLVAEKEDLTNDAQYVQNKRLYILMMTRLVHTKLFNISENLKNCGKSEKKKKNEKFGNLSLLCFSLLLFGTIVLFFFLVFFF